MRWALTLGMVISACVLSGIPAAARATTARRAALPAGNLVVNGDFEGGAAAKDAVATFAPTSWAVLPAPNNPTAVAYGAAGGFPPTSVSAAIGGGKNFFAGGPGGTSHMQQLVNLGAYGEEIDAGPVSARLSADLGGYADQDDSARVAAFFNENTLKTIGNPVTLMGPNAAARGNTTTLLPRAATAQVPKGTRSLSVHVDFFVSQGPYVDGYADNISLQLSSASPPASPAPPSPAPAPPSPPPPATTPTPPPATTPTPPAATTPTPSSN